MIFKLESEDSQNFDIFEMQGELENIDLIDCHFDNEKIQLIFQTFTLQGKKIENEYSIFERIDYKVICYGKIKNHFVFDTGPKFKI